MTALTSGLRRPAALYGLSDAGFLAAVCVLNVVLRLPLLLIHVVPASDSAWYYGRAQSIAAGQGYAQDGVLTAFWPVGWPGFLAGLLRLFGDDVLVGQCANLVLSTGVIGLLAGIGARWFPGAPTWRLAVLVIALLPNQIAYVPLLSVEIYFEFLLLLGLLLMMLQSSRWLLLSGLAFGLAALTKSQALLLPLVLSLPMLGFPPGRAGIARFCRTALLTGTGMMVVVLPWTARNYGVFHTLIPISTNGGFNLLTSNNPGAYGTYTPNDPLVTSLSTNPADQVEMDRTARQRAWNWIARNPGAFVRLIPAKVWYLWSGDGEAEWMYQRGYAEYDTYVVAFRGVRVINQAAYAVVMVLAAASVPSMLRQRRWLSPWCASGWAVMGYFTFISVIFSGQSRFHFALMPFLVLYAAWRVMPGSRAVRTAPP